MKSEAVDCWLKHWLQLRKKGKRPLVLKNSSKRQSESPPKLLAKWKGKTKARDPPVDWSKNSDNLETPIVNVKDGQESDGHHDEDPSANMAPQSTGGLSLSPCSANMNCWTWATFLKTLSNDKHYQKLLLLLKVAQVSQRILSRQFLII